MSDQHRRRQLGRRQFLREAVQAGGVISLAVGAQPAFAAPPAAALAAGEGVVDTTPPLGIELAGYHYPPGKGRLITGIRQPTAARALVLRLGETLAAIVSVDICAFSPALAQRVQSQVAAKTGIPAAHVRLCATHTHSMPTFQPFRQWGAVSPQYMALVEKRIVQAVVLAKADLAPAELSVGKHRAEGANFNRTTKTWKTDKDFGKDATDNERWLDTLVHVLRFDRTGGKASLLWYHFSAHPVCYADGQAGPDWPGEVEKLIQEKDKLAPRFLQGHIGDVNPGPGQPWRGTADQTAARVADAIRQALAGATRVKVDGLRMVTQPFDLPLNLDLFQDQLARYAKDPNQCTKGEWVDAAFAKDWYDSAKQWDLKQAHRSMPLSALRLGSVGFLFHPAELYSFYGLQIRRDSPFADTLIVGYADDFVGYLTDPRAYEAGEYAAIVVPKIVGLPPFTRTAARELAAASGGLLKRVT